VRAGGREAPKGACVRERVRHAPPFCMPTSHCSPKRPGGRHGGAKPLFEGNPPGAGPDGRPAAPLVPHFLHGPGTWRFAEPGAPPACCTLPGVTCNIIRIGRTPFENVKASPARPLLIKWRGGLRNRNFGSASLLKADFPTKGC
jgi:hypothetical protein